MAIRPLIAALSLTALVAACAPTPGPSGGVPGGSTFRVEDFAWSQNSGTASIDGRIAYNEGGQSWSCVGSAGLTPDTPYTRARFNTLYGSTTRAAVPAAVVRARDVGEAAADYRAYVRSERCVDGAFRFSGLPDGRWFIIVPVTAEGAEGPVALMRHVVTRGGRTVNVTL